MNLLLTGAFSYSDTQLAELNKLFNNIYFLQDERIPLDQQDVDFALDAIDAVVCNALFLHNKLSDFPRLRFVQLTSAGFDRVPLHEMQELGMRVENARGIYSIPMAEWAVLKILEIYKYSRSFYRSQDRQSWEKNRNVLELSGRIVSVFGMGCVGIEIARRLQAFGCHLIGVDPCVEKSSCVDEQRDVTESDSILRRSDVIVLALPLNNNTHHFIQAESISVMKDDVVLINVSRGGVIDESALIDALSAGKFRGVALDVFESEPLSALNPMWSIERVIVTPHNSFISDQVGDRLYALIQTNLNDYAQKIMLE